MFIKSQKQGLKRSRNTKFPLAICSRYLLHQFQDGIWIGAPAIPLELSIRKQSITQNNCLIAICQGKEFIQDKQADGLSHWGGRMTAHLRQIFKCSRGNSRKTSRLNGASNGLLEDMAEKVSLFCYIFKWNLRQWTRGPPHTWALGPSPPPAQSCFIRAPLSPAPPPPSPVAFCSHPP